MSESKTWRDFLYDRNAPSEMKDRGITVNSIMDEMYNKDGFIPFAVENINKDTVNYRHLAAFIRMTFHCQHNILNYKELVAICYNAIKEDGQDPMFTMHGLCSKDGVPTEY